MANAYVGTAGWSYDHWRGPFYPKDVKSGQRLAYYAARLSSVEINGSFYRTPAAEAIESWLRAVGPEFVFALKANRYLTHMKRLGEPEQTLPPFLETLERFGHKLGPVLFQTPPALAPDHGLLAAFLERLPRGRRWAFEFRHPGWFREDVYQLLADHDAALVAYELDGFVSPSRTTASFAYLRQHGPGGSYEGSYGESALQAMAGEVRQHLAAGRQAYVYFDNDTAGYAALNAARLRDLLAARDGA